MEILELSDPLKAYQEAIDSYKSNFKILISGSEKSIQVLEERGRSFPAQTKKIDIKVWLDEKKKEVEMRYENDGIDMRVLEGRWSPTKERISFSLGAIHSPLLGIKVKAKNSSEIVSLLNYGGWNNCPPANVHKAIWMHWSKKYHAKIVAISEDSIEAFVGRGPGHPLKALELAWEQYLYCPYIVEQNYGTIFELAARLYHGNTWTFWWD